jgi:hypothetical protein
MSMDATREVGKSLLVFGAFLVVAGAVLALGTKLPFRLGRLPGDIVYRGKNVTFYFPLATSIVLSIVLTLVFWIVSSLRR